MGSISKGGDTVNSIYIGDIEVQQVYKGSTLIWQNAPELTYNWEVNIFNNSSSYSPLEQEEGELYIIDPVTEEELAVEFFTIPEHGTGSNVWVRFSTRKQYTNLTVKCICIHRTLFTSTVTYTQTGTNYYSGSPSSISFQLS